MASGFTAALFFAIPCPAAVFIGKFAASYARKTQVWCTHVQNPERRAGKAGEYSPRGTPKGCAARREKMGGGKLDSMHGFQPGRQRFGFLPAAEGEDAARVVGGFLQAGEHHGAGVHGSLQSGFLAPVHTVGEVAGVVALAAAKGDAPALERSVLVSEPCDVAQSFHPDAQGSRYAPAWRAKK